MAVSLVAENLLRLTDTQLNQSNFVIFSNPVASNQGLSISFDLYAYGGTGADGTGFFLIDGNTTPTQAGGTGGSLGYAPRLSSTPALSNTGLVGGYIGIGFDEFGNYSNATQGRTGGPGFTPDAVVVRGSQANNYRYLTGNQLPSSLDNPGNTATRDASRRRVQIDVSVQGLLNVQIDLNNDGDFLDAGEKPVDQYDLITNNGALPATLKFGFAAATGSQTNIHEVGYFTVADAAGNPITGSLGGLISFGDSGNDIPPSSGGGDTLSGGGGLDTLVGGAGADDVTGGTDADRFVFSGPTQRAALRSSNLQSMDRINDFNWSEGDRFQLDFDNNLSTVQLPKGLFNAGTHKGGLRKVLKQVYADKNFKRKGEQALKADEAVFFKIGQRTYLSVNDNKPSFSAANDLVANVTGIEFKGNDFSRGALGMRNYFV